MFANLYSIFLKTGPNSWQEQFSQCGGSSQSPIDLEDSKVTVFYPGDFIFYRYEIYPLSMKLENNGHTGN